jgi:hypothetical protein
MSTRLLLLPALCLSGAALLLAPARTSLAFTTIGGSLNETQRDVRVFDNFADAASNNNITPSPQFPGQTGAELAIWKGVTEWGSRLHGDGTGDPQPPIGGNPLGSGGANFDAFWAGIATGAGTTNNNIVSAQAAACANGVLAFTETPISDGWRILFCDSAFTFADGPSGINFNHFDIQGILCHEYGHALGLGHSGVSGATMFPSVTPGGTGPRSIAADDIAGVKSIYGVASATKPIISATVASAGTLTIHGSNFGATGNEVWFRSNVATATGVDPIVRVTGVASTGNGTVVSVTIPGNAGVGDVIVKKTGAGGANISNAFPTDLVGTFGTPPGTVPDITSVTPSIIEALIPGTDKTIALGGTNLNFTTSVLLDGAPIDPSRYTIVNATSITLDMPQASSLGAHTLGVTNGVATDNFGVSIVVTSSAKLQWGTGDALNLVHRDDGLDIIVAGNPGEIHGVFGSPSGPPARPDHFRTRPVPLMQFAGSYMIPAKGWLEVNVGGLPDPTLVGALWFGRSYVLGTPLRTSNDQSIALIP